MVTGLWVWVWMHRLLPFCVIPSSELCISFPHFRALSYISPENNPLAFCKCRGKEVITMLVEDFMGTGYSVNWPSSNHLVLSSKCQIHFSWCLCLQAPSEVLQGQWACFSELSSSVGPTFHFYSAQPVTIHQLAFCFYKCVDIYQLLYAPSFSLADLSSFFLLNSFANLVRFQKGEAIDTWAQCTWFN